MAGCLIPHTPIAVDYWRKRDIRSKVCFLSHMHTDHTQGLTSSWDQVIFCSEITRSLAIEQLKIQPSLLVAIPVGQSTIIPLDNAGMKPEIRITGPCSLLTLFGRVYARINVMPDPREGGQTQGHLTF
jgi:hypothetical protein